jgi:predicted transcriptional regulator
MKLQEYLQSKDMTISEFSRKAGIPIPNIWRYVRDRRPSLLNLRYIKEATNGKVTEKDFP